MGGGSGGRRCRILWLSSSSCWLAELSFTIVAAAVVVGGGDGGGGMGGGSGGRRCRILWLSSSSCWLAELSFTIVGYVGQNRKALAAKTPMQR